jgi:hypothetical protein
MRNQSIPSTENKVYVIPENGSQLLKEKEFSMTTTLSENKGLGNFSTTYPVESFEFIIGPKSTICPENNCEFEIEDGSLWSFNAGEYTFGGVMKISTQDEDGKKSKFMDVDADLKVGEILEKNGIKTEKLGGYLDLGTSISYRIINSSLITDEDKLSLSLKGSEVK